MKRRTLSAALVFLTSPAWSVAPKKPPVLHPLQSKIKGEWASIDRIPQKVRFIPAGPKNGQVDYLFNARDHALSWYVIKGQDRISIPEYRTVYRLTIKNGVLTWQVPKGEAGYSGRVRKFKRIKAQQPW